MLPDHPQTTVLCIDDEDDQLLLRKLLLEKEGYRVFTATSGEEGIRLFQTEHMDLVIVDYWDVSDERCGGSARTERTAQQNPHHAALQTRPESLRWIRDWPAHLRLS